MLQVESDLEKSKSLREEQIKSSNHQVEEIKSSHRKKVFYLILVFDFSPLKKEGLT